MVPANNNNDGGDQKVNRNQKGRKRTGGKMTRNGGRGAGNNNNNNNNRSLSGKKLSHALSWALRHGALDIGLSITPDGYVPVQEILDSSHPRIKGATLEDIQDVVQTSDKQRFKLDMRPRQAYEKDGDSDKDKMILCIRANQGHSIDIIDPNLLLTKLTPEALTALPCVVHGTYQEPWQVIQQQGLKKMNRTHIHFASGLAQDSGVISGMRKSCQIYIYINVQACAQDAVEFFTSDNGVILTSGINEEGVLPPKYFSHVTDASGTILLDQRTGTNIDSIPNSQPQTPAPTTQFPTIQTNQPWSLSSSAPVLPLNVEFIPSTPSNMAFQQHMLLLVGIPGSGKSTFARALEKAMPYKFVRINQDELKNRQSCENKCREVLSTGKCPVIDRCNFDATQRSSWSTLASQAGVPVDCLIFYFPIKECIRRCEARTDHETIQPEEARQIINKFRGQLQLPICDSDGNPKKKGRNKNKNENQKEEGLDETNWYRSVQTIRDNNAFNDAILDCLNKK